MGLHFRPDGGAGHPEDMFTAETSVLRVQAHWGGAKGGLLWTELCPFKIHMLGP